MMNRHTKREKKMKELKDEHFITQAPKGEIPGSIFNKSNRQNL